MPVWTLLSVHYRLQFDYPDRGWSDANRIVLASRGLELTYDRYEQARNALLPVVDSTRFRIIRAQRHVEGHTPEGAKA